MVNKRTLTYLIRWSRVSDLIPRHVTIDRYRIRMNRILLIDKLTTRGRQWGMVENGRKGRTQTASTLLYGIFSILLGWL